MEINNKFTLFFDAENYRQKILFFLRNDKEQLANELIKKIANQNYINNWDIDWLYDFFSPIYDELFYDFMFKKIDVTVTTKELLETLSLPLYKMEKSQKDNIIKKIK